MKINDTNVTANTVKQKRRKSNCNFGLILLIRFVVNCLQPKAKAKAKVKVKVKVKKNMKSNEEKKFIYK